MGEINIPRDEQNALKGIDTNELDRLIDLAIREERLGDLRRLPLTSCGSYVATKLHYFEQALAKHRLAKAPRKRAETENTLRRAGSDLSFAFGAMKSRMEAEEKEGQLFYVDDQIVPSYRFSKHLSVRVSYRWRRTVDDEWTFGSITFVHDVDLGPGYAGPAPKRKPSAAKQEQDLQNRSSQTWEHLMRGALYSVRDYFREGGDGDKIPETFQATVDSHGRGLNNYSTQFWRKQPGSHAQPRCQREWRRRLSAAEPPDRDAELHLVVDAGDWSVHHALCHPERPDFVTREFSRRPPR
jgi:hypothetical protein